MFQSMIKVKEFEVKFVGPKRTLKSEWSSSKENICFNSKMFMLISPVIIIFLYDCAKLLNVRKNSHKRTPLGRLYTIAGSNRDLDVDSEATSSRSRNSVLFKVYLFIELVTITKRIGLQTEPCGTPEETF